MVCVFLLVSSGSVVVPSGSRLVLGGFLFMKVVPKSSGVAPDGSKVIWFFRVSSCWLQMVLVGSKGF